MSKPDSIQIEAKKFAKAKLSELAILKKNTNQILKLIEGQEKKMKKVLKSGF